MGAKTAELGRIDKAGVAHKPEQRPPECQRLRCLRAALAFPNLAEGLRGCRQPRRVRIVVATATVFRGQFFT